MRYARDLRNHLRHFNAQMVAGVPPHILIQRHWPYLYPQQQLIADYLPMLRKAKIGDFSKLTNDPPFREVPIPTEPVRLHKMEWRDSTAHSVGWESYAAFRLSTEMVVACIRIAYNATNQRKVPPCVKLEWNGEANGMKGAYTMWPTGDRGNWERCSWLRIGQRRTEVSVWINAKVSEIRLYPDSEPSTFHLEELVLLVPESENTASAFAR